MLLQMHLQGYCTKKSTVTLAAVLFLIGIDRDGNHPHFHFTGINEF